MLHTYNVKEAKGVTFFPFILMGYMDLYMRSIKEFYTCILCHGLQHKRSQKEHNKRDYKYFIKGSPYGLFIYYWRCFLETTTEATYISVFIYLASIVEEKPDSLCVLMRK